MGVRIVYPDSWEVLKLGEIAESEKGKKPKNESSEQSEVHQFPYIDIEAFEKRIAYDDLYKIKIKN